MNKLSLICTITKRKIFHVSEIWTDAQHSFVTSPIRRSKILLNFTQPHWREKVDRFWKNFHDYFVGFSDSETKNHFLFHLYCMRRDSFSIYLKFFKKFINYFLKICAKRENVVGSWANIHSNFVNFGESETKKCFILSIRETGNSLFN